MNKGIDLPFFLIALDGLGSIILILGVLGLLKVDIGLPVLFTVWAIRKALALKQKTQERM